MRVKPFSEEVVFTEDDLVTAGPEDIEFLKGRAKGNRRERMRICAHKNLGDSLHEMLIVHYKGAYVRPHKHLNKTESSHIIEGLVDLIVYDDDGNITEVVHMGDHSTGMTFYYRMSEPRYHTLLIRSDVLVFHETTSGPFRSSDMLLAPWSPEESDTAAVDAFMVRLRRMARAE